MNCLKKTLPLDNIKHSSKCMFPNEHSAVFYIFCECVKTVRIFQRLSSLVWVSLLLFTKCKLDKQRSGEKVCIKIGVNNKELFDQWSTNFHLCSEKWNRNKGVHLLSAFIWPSYSCIVRTVTLLCLPNKFVCSEILVKIFREKMNILNGSSIPKWSLLAHFSFFHIESTFPWYITITLSSIYYFKIFRLTLLFLILEIQLLRMQ